MALTYSGYGGSTHGSELDAAKSALAGIGQTSFGGYEGRTATEVVDKFRSATGADEHKTAKFARQVAAKYGRYI